MLFITLPFPILSNQVWECGMDLNFETLIAGYIESSVGVVDHFLSDELCAALQVNVIALNNQQQLVLAEIGNDGKRKKDELVRNDKIYWLDKSHGNASETQFLEQMEAFIAYLNSTCFTAITSYEFHYSLYEAGSFYLPHLDQFKNHGQRQFSMVSYLNADWLDADGGELLLHLLPEQQLVSPQRGKTVFFKSDVVLHEVLITHARRFSVTGWLKRG